MVCICIGSGGSGIMGNYLTIESKKYYTTIIESNKYYTTIIETNKLGYLVSLKIDKSHSLEFI